MVQNKRLLFTMLFFVMALLSKGVGIKINAPEYAGSSFAFYTVPNFLTEKQEIIGEGTVDKNGQLSLNVEVTTTLPIYSEFGVYKGWFIAVPGKDYELILPPFELKKTTNPYFRPKINHLGIKNVDANDINVLIEDFNRQYIVLMSQNNSQILNRRSMETAEKVVAELQLKFPTTTNKYFEDYKTYKYASIKRLAVIQDPTVVVNEYFLNKPILYDLPEYSELFDQIFTKHIQYATQDVNGQKIAVILNSGAFEQLMDWLTDESMFNKELAEAVILKGVKTLFYSKKFNTAGLFSILQKITATSALAVHKASADKIFNELARTMYGAIAPELNLVDITGNFVNWENFEGKYVYLCFTRTDNERFVPHKELLKEIQLKYKQDLAVVIVLEDDAIEKNAALLKSDGFEWTVLRGATRKEIYESFNVRMLPTYFLVDPQARMAGNQAPWPDENFELQFANILKATKN